METFGKKSFSPGDKVFVFVEANREEKTITVLGHGVFEGVFARGDEDSTEPVDRTEGVLRVLRGDTMTPRIRLDNGDVCWDDEVHWVDLAEGLEWSRPFSIIRTTVAEMRAASDVALAAHEAELAEREVSAESWRVNPEPEPEPQSWRCA